MAREKRAEERRAKLLVLEQERRKKRQQWAVQQINWPLHSADSEDASEEVGGAEASNEKGENVGSGQGAETFDIAIARKKAAQRASESARKERERKAREEHERLWKQNEKWRKRDEHLREFAARQRRSGEPVDDALSDRGNMSRSAHSARSPSGSADGGRSAAETES